MAMFKGSGKAELVFGGDDDTTFFGEGGADVIEAGIGNDILHGGGGDDRLMGNAGDDVIYGGVSSRGAVDFNKFQIAEDVAGTVTFLGESAGYRNTLGMYKISDDGTIYDVEILFANASLKGSGGSLISGQSSVDVDLSAGDKVGFFVVPNSYAKSGMSKLLNDTDGSFRFAGPGGEQGNVNGGSEVTLVHVSASGKETDIKSQYGTSVFHSQGGAEGGLNGDNFKHVKGEVSVDDGTVRIGFEDLKGGGDKDFDDSVFVLNIGKMNAALLAKEQTKKVTSTDDDMIFGGEGADKLFGLRGEDFIEGGDGDDVIYGNSGNDVLLGDAGNDVIKGGSGVDLLIGGDGDDELHGNSGDDNFIGDAGDDKAFGSSGNDTFFDGAGNDHYEGGSGEDVFFGASLDGAASGNDLFVGGSGNDTLNYSYGSGTDGITVDLSKHVIEGYGTDEAWSVETVIGTSADDTFKGDKRDNTLIGGAGEDTFRGLGGSDVFTGGDGADVFVWLAKDVLDKESGRHLGVDRITDFDASEGDQINLRKIVKDLEYDSIEEVVDIRDTDDGAVVAVKLANSFVDVVSVDGVSAADLVADGLILS